MTSRFEIPVRSGRLCLVMDGDKAFCEYHGVISREYALELVRDTPDGGSFQVNGTQTLAEFMESLL